MLENYYILYSMIVSKKTTNEYRSKMIYISLANNVWFDNFRQQLITMRNEFLALLSHCLEGGQAAAIDFILNRHVNIITCETIN